MMAQWYVKELSKLTGVSVQTLHHYDRIDLLNPSLRLPNGYRVYSEGDLLRLQQILALKYFGFELANIKTLLTGKVNMRDHFTVQAKFLQEKGQTLLSASETLENLLASCNLDESIPWETILQLIEVFKMTNELEKTWAAEVFTPDELRQYARFEKELHEKSTPEAKQRFTEQWRGLIGEIHANLDQDPKGAYGLNMAKTVMDLVNKLYGEEHINLRHSIWEKGFKKGKMECDRTLEPEIVAWLDSAIDNYYRQRIYRLLAEVENNLTPEVKQRWDELMTEMYGNSEPFKQALYEEGKKDPQVGPKAKKWLEGLS
jgi:DNA-binding transcriptional MerR regulator